MEEEIYDPEKPYISNMNINTPPKSVVNAHQIQILLERISSFELYAYLDNTQDQKKHIMNLSLQELILHTQTLFFYAIVKKEKVPEEYQMYIHDYMANNKKHLA